MNHHSDTAKATPLPWAASVAEPVLGILPAGTTAAFSLGASARPAGFGMNGNGSLSGSPSTQGCFPLAITATADAVTGRPTQTSGADDLLGQGILDSHAVLFVFGS